MPRRNAILILAAAPQSKAAAAQREEPPLSLVTIYRAAPGHQAELLKLIARQDELRRTAGLPPYQLYVHESGASWDFVTIAPGTTAEQDDAIARAAARAGVPTGPKAGLELRRHITEHSDTVAVGPTTAAAILRRIAE
jgi:hypothetical protein